MGRRYIPKPATSAGVKDANGMFMKQPAPAVVPFNLDDILFDKQRKFVADPRPFKNAVCSRRAGKTVACAADLIDTALKHEGITCLYITLARTNAQRLLWPELLKLNTKYNLKGIPDLVQLTLTFPNQSIVWCSGAKDASEIEKFRGHALKKVYIDECQSFRAHLKELIDDVLIPALMDYDGSLCLIGTPGPVPAGYFAEVSGAVKRTQTEEDHETDNDYNWVNYHWTFFDNPHIALKSKKTHDQVLKRVLKMRGVTIEDPSIQREFFGKWVMDQDSLWIKYNPELNSYAALPTGKKWNYILGIDIGFNDADALAVLAWHDHSKDIYLVEEKVTTKQDLTDLVENIKDIQSRYDISKMVIDAGGLGKKLAEELRRRHQIPVQDADKARKQENVAFLNAALRSGRFKAKDDSKFAQDTYLVEIDRDKSTADRIRVSDKYHSDIIDAVLYAFRESPAYAYEEPEAELVYGSPEWAKAQEASMFEAELEGLRNEARIRGEYGGYDD
jgi:hypothetical protein